MPWPLYFQSLIGGAVIGLAAAMLLLINGRVAGVIGAVGGVVDGLLGRIDGEFWERTAFVAGLILGPFVFLLVFGALPAVTITASLPVLVAGGLLVGFGTRLGKGCTAGHGVCGLARLSPRSIVAVATFFGVAIVTVFAMEHVL
ncbi:MAG: YeeE/YedE family protein [Propylenella sp.]